MYIQVLDYHDNQYIFYYDNKINIDTNLPSDATCTWNYNTFLKDCNLKFANIYVQGADSKDYCPESLAHHYDFYCTKIETYQNIYEKRKNAPNAKIIDLINPSILLDYCKIREQICNNVLSKVEEPKHYAIMSKIIKIIETIKFQDINLEDNSPVSKYDNHIYYNPWNVVTGRMGLYPKHFPITNLSKKLRKHVLCKNSYFYELDYNSAEIRVILSLMGVEVESNRDIHDYHNKIKFNNNATRDEVKRDFYSWLYDEKKHCDFYESLYKKKSILNLKSKHYVNGNIHTDFGRVIKCEEKNWLNYLAQSTASDLFFEQVYKIWKFILDSNLKTEISFLLHDCFVLDVKKEESEIIKENIPKIFANNRYGEYIVNQKTGLNYGEMK